jgi:glycosyltransferase involved in cell wall biosynthesis
MNNKNINFIANMITGTISGGDRIWIECAKRWLKSGYNINIFTNEKGIEMGKYYGLLDANYILWSSKKFDKSSFTIKYLARTITGCRNFLRELKIDDNSIIYSTSDFWPDSLPAYFLKCRNKNLKWIAGFFLFAPFPLRKDSPYKGSKWFIGLFYWITQLPVYWIIKKKADVVFVTSEPDVKKFVTGKRQKTKVIVIKGGVDLKESDKYLSSKFIIPVDKRKYDSCFVGRLHYQKGVLKLIDIWRNVVNIKKDALLAIIGAGPLEEEIKTKIKKNNLIKNIDFLGFKDGEEKFEIFKQSKIVVHPATYDSGGMAAAEALAWGLPGVSFDLESLKTYYPKGILKVSCYNEEEFAGDIIKLLEDENLYDKVSREAIGLAHDWNWDKRATEILEEVESQL